MAIKLPDELKAQVPTTILGKVMLATPVVMAVLATMLAGLASGEMGKAQYCRSLGAQLQSKAGDQWGLFQAKKLRAVTQRNTHDLLDSMGGEAAVDLAAIEQAAVALPEALGALEAQVREAVARTDGQTEACKARKGSLEEFLRRGPQRASEALKAKAGLLEVVKAPVAPAALEAALRGQTAEAGEEVAMTGSLKALLGAMEDLRPDAETAALTAKVSDADVEAALQGAKNRVNNFDQAAKPFNQWIDRAEKLLAGQAAMLREGRLLLAQDVAGGGESLYRGFVGARLRYTAARYDAEARLNQTLATLCEVQVRRANLAADRHRARSEKFFYGMLGAQLAVIVATFAVAARKRSLVWSLAAVAGVFAVVFGVYVYLYV